MTSLGKSAIFACVALLALAPHQLRAQAPAQQPWRISGTILDTADRPVAHLSVFLDRGRNTIERYETDSLGHFELTFRPDEYFRATWLACVPGGIPIIDFPRPGVVYLDSRYGTSAHRDTVFHFYKSSGWKGPIPRECPPAADSMGWRFPASANHDPGAYSRTEPDWQRFPGPPHDPLAPRAHNAAAPPRR